MDLPLYLFSTDGERWGIVTWAMDYKLDPLKRYNAFWKCIVGFKICVLGSTYLFLAANSLAFLDLYLSLKNPFYPRSKRQPFYFCSLAITMVLISFLIYHNITSRGSTILEYNHYKGNGRLNSIFFVFAILMGVLTVIPCALVGR